MSADQPTVLLVEDEPAQREVLGYNLQADGFHVLTASNGEEALLMVSEMPPATVGERLEYLDIVLDAETHRVTRSEKSLKLGPTEFRLLSTFMEKPGRVWSREQLLDRVWGRDIYVDTRTVDVHIGRLRKALCQHGGDDPLRTVRGAMPWAELPQRGSRSSSSACPASQSRNLQSAGSRPF